MINLFIYKENSEIKMFVFQCVILLCACEITRLTGKWHQKRCGRIRAEIVTILHFNWFSYIKLYAFDFIFYFFFLTSNLIDGGVCVLSPNWVWVGDVEFYDVFCVLTAFFKYVFYVVTSVQRIVKIAILLWYGVRWL